MLEPLCAVRCSLCLAGEARRRGRRAARSTTCGSWTGPRNPGQPRAAVPPAPSAPPPRSLPSCPARGRASGCAEGALPVFIQLCSLCATGDQSGCALRRCRRCADLGQVSWTAAERALLSVLCAPSPRTVVCLWQVAYNAPGCPSPTPALALGHSGPPRAAAHPHLRRRAGLPLARHTGGRRGCGIGRDLVS